MIIKKTFPFLCLIFVVFIISFFAVKISFSKKESPAATILNPDVNQSEITKTPGSSETPKTYFVTSHDEVVCIYSCDENSKILTDAITYIDIYSLDDDVRRSLETGIMFQNRFDLTVFLENIGS